MFAVVNCLLLRVVLGLDSPHNICFVILFYIIVVQGCKTKVGLRNILCLIQKKDKGWWKRLLESEEKPAPYLKVDWNKWCDEDEGESACKPK